MTPAPLPTAWIEALFTSSGDGIAFCDANGKFLRVNAALARMLGYTRAQLSRLGFRDITPPEFLHLCISALNGLAAGGPPCSFDKEYVRKNGSRLAVHVRGFSVRGRDRKPACFAVIVRDMSALRAGQSRTDAALREALSLSEAALESTGDGILVIDLKGRIRSFNNRFLDMWRIPKKIAASGDDDQALRFVLGQVRKPEQFVARVKELYSRPDAESFDTLEFKDGRIFERYSRPQRIGTEIVGRVWCFRDATPRRRLERQLAQASSREQERLGRELHDSIGQTLTAITLIAKSAVAKPTAASLTRIEKLTRVAIRQTRSLARGLLPPELAHGDLGGALSSLVDGARELYGARCALTVRGRAVLSDRATAVELYRIAQEAVFNAAKHSGRKNGITLALVCEPKRARLTVRDLGAGLPKGAENGPGLGLAIMRHRAQMVGATLDIRRGPKGGTTVFCDCPL